MSMLAERKRKQKWSLNPRGKEWAQDTNKFGHKMLEKMGWSSGKGLGAKENGITEHIKVAYKNDSKGLGHTDRNDQWTEHESNFSALLSSLGGTENTTDELKVSSLEEKSQKSRARVHYKKFTRGKDISRYSEKDLANIFGKKSLDDLKRSQTKMNDNQKDKNGSAVDHQPTSKFAVNGGLMSDYFKKKLPNFGNINGFVVGNNGVLKRAENSDSESESQRSFGFGFQSDKAATVLGIENNEDIKKTSFISFVSGSVKDTNKNKKRKNEDEIFVEIETPSKKKKVDTSFEETSSKKKKSKKTEESIGLSNPAFDPMHSSPIKIQKHTLDIIEESVSEDTIEQEAEHFDVSVQVYKNNKSVSKKQKKKKNSFNLSEEGFDDTSKKKAQNPDFSEDSLEISLNKKTKKNKKSKNEETCDSFSINSRESIDEIPQKKKSNKREKKGAEMGVENLYFNTSTENEEINSVENKASSPRKKFKKNKNKVVEEDDKGVENLFFNTSIESNNISLPQENPYEIKIKEKKKNKKKNKSEKEKGEYGVANPNFVENIDTKDSVEGRFEIKRKKSKKHQQLEEAQVGVDNPALNLSANIEENFELMLNIANTPVTKVPSKLSKERSFNVSRVQRSKSVRFSDVTRERIIPTKEEIKMMEESQDSDIELDLLDDSLDIEGRLKSDETEKSSKLFKIKKKSKKNKVLGLINQAYDAQKNNLEENLNCISKTLDQYQAELENDINEAKMKSVEISDIMVGEVGNDQGDNELLPNGSVKLKFKNAKLRKSAKYYDALQGPKKPYKHLIKGDITVDFKESNLHEIQGYAATERVV